MKLDLELLRASTSAMIFQAGKPDVKDVPLLEALKKHKNTIDAMREEQKTQAANADRFTMQALNMGLLMDAARDYLMTVNPSNVSGEEIVEDTLEKLGFGRNGLESNFMTA